MNTAQSLADGAAGAALLHLETGNWPAAYEALRHATMAGVSIAAGASLYYGAPALAFVLAGTDHPGLAHARAVTAQGTVTVTRQRLDAAHRRIDGNKPPHFAEYDLIQGLTGLGVTLRRLDDHDTLRHVLDYLVRLTEPRNELPGWWCWNSPESSEPPLVGGHSNLGMAHGITGPLALLALTHRDGITVAGHTDAIARICQWMDTWQQHTNDTIWWPQTVTLADLRRGSPAQRTPLRPSWCYGTPGIARAHQLAGQTLHDTDRQRLAETAFAACLADPAQTRQLTDRDVCHGTAGLLAAANRIAADALTPVALTAIEQLHRQANPSIDGSGGLLAGTIGAELATLTATTTAWDACLLLA